MQRVCSQTCVQKDSKGKCIRFADKCDLQLKDDATCMLNCANPVYTACVSGRGGCTMQGEVCNKVCSSKDMLGRCREYRRQCFPGVQSDQACINDCKRAAHLPF